MDFIAKTADPDKIRTACVVVALFSSRQMSDAAKALDKACQGQLTALVKSGDISTHSGALTLIHQTNGKCLAERILVAGCGSRKSFDKKSFQAITRKVATKLNAMTVKDAISYLPELEVENCTLEWKCRQSALISQDAVYRFDETKSTRKPPKNPLNKLTLGLIDKTGMKQARSGITQGKAIGDGMSLCRRLGNLPGNLCTPTDLAKSAQALGKSYTKLKVSVLEESAMKKLGMGSLLSVSRGSREPAKLITLQYSGASRTQRPVVLVGKGVTFDSGGISIKSGSGMDEMKFDMCGAASVLGTMKAVAEMGLPINVVGVVPATENLPDGDASKPGDVVTSMSGQTIEVLNTDAEGRLILCDALTYANKFKPEIIIDIATLTGACIVALGHHTMGVMANDQDLADEILAAGQTAGDRAWQLPIWEEYDKQISSNFADMANIGSSGAGTITAACFLARFTKDYRWAHLDIAGVAWKSGASKGATGRPVPLLTQLLLSRCGS